MIIEVHQANHSFVLDIRLSLVTQTELLLALIKFFLLQLYVQAADNILEDGLFDYATLEFVKLT